MLLLDMNMPKSCKDCRINVYGRCGALRTSVLQEMVNEERNDNCPIKAEIPKNATNGDMMLELLKEKEDSIYPVEVGEMGIKVPVEWWNAPYRG